MGVGPFESLFLFFFFFFHPLAFGVTPQHILEKARQKAMQDAAAKVETSFTDERIKTLFCNIEEIAAMHEDLIEVLDKTCASSLSYDTPIAGCYLVIVSQPAARTHTVYVLHTHRHACVNMLTSHIHPHIAPVDPNVLPALFILAGQIRGL